MIRYLIKNNFKIMMRSGVNILLYIVCPVLVSAVLISAFSSLMENYKPDEEFMAKYGAIEANFEDQVNDNQTNFADQTNADQSEDADQANGMTSSFNISAINIEHPYFVPAIDSTDYYGIIEVVYFGWCAIVCISGLLSSEKKNRINDKLYVSNLSVTQIYLARLIPLSITCALGVSIAAVIGMVFMGVHWGNLVLSAIVVILMIFAASAFEMMLYEITNSMLVTIIVSFAIVWIWGFFGGSFETYMFSPHSMTLKNIDPIYHGNRALVELSCMGHSDYVLSSVIYSVLMIVVCSIVAVFAGNVRRRKGA